MEVTILPKGGSVDIKAKAPNLTKLLVGTGWDVNEVEGGASYDLDLTAALLGSDGKVVENGVVYYQNLAYKADGTVVVKHTGDNLTGAGEGDDESIEVELDKVPATIDRIAFLVNIYEAASKNQNFGAVNSSFVRIVDANTKEEIARHDLKSEYASNSGVLVGELLRESGAWHFKATAEGVNGSIDQILSARGMK